MKETIFIQNLKCGGCAASIERELKKFPEVQTVEVDFDEQGIQIETDQTGQTEKYKTALRAIGYPPVGQSNPLLRQAQSFVSCAIGRVTA